MIGVTLKTTQDGGYSVLTEFVDGALTAIDRAAKATFDEVRPQMLDELSFEPRKRKYPSDYPLEWTSDKQRKAYFATNGFGGGIPYQRTGNLARGWRVEWDDTTNQMIVYNVNDYAKYVVGTLVDGYNPVQRFHQITGWFPARKTIDYWFNVYLDELAKKLRKLEGQ